MPYRRLARLAGALVGMLAIVCLMGACTLGDVLIPTALPLPKVGEDKETIIIPQLTATPDESPRRGPAIDLPPTWTPASVPGPAPISPPNKATSPNPAQNSYIVQVGDTLAEIAIQFNVDLDLLAQTNNITDHDHIEVGQELVIPTK